ncbi:hypothetical protein P8C59_009454 [Phyllachora maydis]|uniref:Autophagy-related protein 13 n=1 Tax=Phyllachora maydis TaxID=1825666 RepID=A0AAD9IEH3_9PEZI|nr:hypothetical protein P8C59_009454 [Phyllachora maydis]
MGPTRESVKKLDQIIQNFHSKAAVLILQSRMHTTPAGDRKQSKWFQIETNDVDEFRDDFKIWRQAGSFDNRPPPMIIETYIDASRLSNGQSLVILDENGKRWDALEVLNSSESSSAEGSPPRLRERNTEIVLERWRIELRCLPTDEPGEFGPSLPTIYKRSIVFFRSLFTITRVMPCWKLAQQSMAKTGHPALQVKCRFRTAEPDYLSYDPLRLPLFDGRDVVTEYMFGDLEVPVGRLYASVSYRNDCSFRVDDSESLLSSRFTGVDENFFRPTMAINRPPQPGSGLLAEAGAGGSSGSLQNDDDNISDFLKALDSRKTLQSFDTTKKGESFAAKRTAAQLSKFHLMKDSNNALTESMTSSMHLHRSSSSSSRQLQNVPAMTRLRQGARNPDIGEEMTDDDEDGDDDDDDDDDEGAPVSQEGTRAIEIPLSPRVLQHGTFSSARRSSSVAQREQPRRAARRDQDAMADADMLPGQRSISLGAGERGEAPTLSTLLGRQAAAGVGAGGQGAGAGVLQPPAEIRAAAAAAAALGKPSLSPGAHARGGSGDSPGQLFPSASGHRGTLRYNQGGALGSDSGSRPSPQPSSRESFSGGRYAASQARGGLGVVGGVGGEEGDTDEPLVFAMSELERDSRRSLDEARALGVVGLGGRRGGGRGGGEGSGSASDSRDKGGFEPRGVTKRGW